MVGPWRLFRTFCYILRTMGKGQTVQSPIRSAADKVADAQRRKVREDAWGGAETSTALESMERGQEGY